MNILIKSNNQLIQEIFDQLEQTQANNNKIIEISMLSNEGKASSITVFSENLTDLALLNTIIDYSTQNHTHLFYIETTHLYGLTEMTSVSETHPHKPLSTKGKIREEFYQKILHTSELQYTILRIPSLLGHNCNFSFDNVFANKSSFIQWPGLTHINHEFLSLEDASRFIAHVINLQNSNPSGQNQEFNISGTKFTAEQIAATIHELTGKPVKLNQMSVFMLWLKSFSDMQSKDIFENLYLYQKPVFLNGEKFFRTFPELKVENDLQTIISSVIHH